MSRTIPRSDPATGPPGLPGRPGTLGTLGVIRRAGDAPPVLDRMDVPNDELGEHPPFVARDDSESDGRLRRDGVGVAGAEDVR